MAEIKWIKLSTDIFNNRKIRQIECMPDGDTIIVIWFKILALAGEINDSGQVYLTKEIPYTDQLLATQFNRPIATIRLALQTFQQFGMVEIIDDLILVSNWEKYQNIEGMERVREQTRARVAKCRENKRLQMPSQICQYCGGVATGYDHILAQARGGTDDPENLVPCCKACNQIKNDKPVVDFLNNYRERIRDDIVTANENLRRYVTLCNATNRYVVTLCNATEREGEKEKKRITPPIVPPTGENDVPDRFDQFWEKYPKKVGKGDAEKSFKRIRPDAELFDKMMTALDGIKKSEQWTRENGRFIPNPATWLNQKRWEDEIPVATTKSSGGIESTFDTDEFFEKALQKSYGR